MYHKDISKHDLFYTKIIYYLKLPTHKKQRISIMNNCTPLLFET